MQTRYESGAKVLGRYVVERVLGEGGMGTVYVAHHAELARKRFAIKTLRADLFGYAGAEERFRREAELLATLEHPGIVSIVDFGMDGKTPVMVMELLQGETLRDRLAHFGPLPLDEVARVVREVAAVLDFAHQRELPVIHRDLKPENLFLVQPDDRVKVLDFGIAKVAGSSSMITQTSSALGTPSYMSPEQLRDARKVGPATDFFSLASIAYECIVGKPAFPGEGIGGVVLAIFDAARPRASELRPGVPPEVDAVLARAWSVDPAQRFPTAGDFARALGAALAGAASSAHTVGSAPTLPHGAVPPVATPPAVAPAVAPVGDPAGAAIVPSTTSVAAVAASASAIPQTRQNLAVPAGQAPPAAFAPAHPTQTPLAGERAPSHSTGRVPLIVGGGIALVAVVLGVAFVATRATRDGVAPPHVAPAPRDAAVVVPADPVVGQVQPARPVDPASQPQPQPAQRDAGGVATGGSRDPFDVARRSLQQPIRECARGATTVRSVNASITWAGPTGYPSRVVLDRDVPMAVRQCISSAVARHGRIPAQRAATVTRRFTFALR